MQFSDWTTISGGCFRAFSGDGVQLPSDSSGGNAPDGPLQRVPLRLQDPIARGRQSDIKVSLISQGWRYNILSMLTHIYPHCLVAQFCEVGRSPCLCFCEVGKSCAWCGRQSAVQSVDALARLLLSEDGLEDLLSMQLYWHQQSLGCLIGYTTHLKQGRL